MQYFEESLKGKFLVASPSLMDPNFKEGVVFLCDHNEKGAFGIIINKLSHLKAETHLADDEHHWIRKMDLFFGGPVSTNHVLVLCRSQSILFQEYKICHDIILLSHLSEKYQKQLFVEANKENIRMYVGCAGWGEYQLESEISAGAWKVLPSVEEMIYSSHPDKIWKENLFRLGGHYKILSEMPGNDDILNN